jgi:hypothetical protein
MQPADGRLCGPLAALQSAKRLSAAPGAHVTGHTTTAGSAELGPAPHGDADALTDPRPGGGARANSVGRTRTLRPCRCAGWASRRSRDSAP